MYKSSELLFHEKDVHESPPQDPDRKIPPCFPGSHDADDALRGGTRETLSCGQDMAATLT